MKTKCQPLFLSLLFAGIIVFFVGFYFNFVKAGLPYQDPTTEMTIQWLANERAGNTCMATGSIIAVVGAVGHIVAKFIP